MVFSQDVDEADKQNQLVGEEHEPLHIVVFKTDVTLYHHLQQYKAVDAGIAASAIKALERHLVSDRRNAAVSTVQ